MLVWKERLRDWTGTAGEMAVTVAEISAEIGIEDELVPNERLVRHYVQQGVIQRPNRSGKEALFGFRQIVEYLSGRTLLRDGWPLAKVAEFHQATGLQQLLDMLPRDRQRNRAEQLVARFKGAGAKSRVEEGDSLSILSHSAELTRNRIARREALMALGEPAAGRERLPVVRLILAPWCHVYFDPQVLRGLSPDTAELIGRALTECLLNERTRKGD